LKPDGKVFFNIDCVLYFNSGFFVNFELLNFKSQRDSIFIENYKFIQQNPIGVGCSVIKKKNGCVAPLEFD
jgi:hypothetical protein